MLRVLLTGLFVFALPGAVFANATVESLRGIAQAGGNPLMQGQKITAPTAISTDPGTQLSLKFDDGMHVVLHENSLLRVVDYRYSSSGVTDRAVLELLRGAARVVTGSLVEADPKQFYFRTPQTQIMVQTRGADFTVVLVNPAYVSVKTGGVTASNTSGTTNHKAGSLIQISSNAATPTAISASALPPGASAAINGLGTVALGAPAGGGAAVGTAAVAGGAGSTGFLVPAVLLAVGLGVAAAATVEDHPLSTTTHH